MPPTPGAAPADPRERARAIIVRHGWNAAAYQALNPGIALWFAAAGDAVAGYVDHAGVRVVAGAPACAPERLAAVVAELEADAARARRRVCYFGAGERLERHFAATLPPNARRRAMVLLGAQPVWDPRGWEGILRRRASLRAQCNRARNKGVVVSEWPAARAHAEPALRGVLAAWLATRGLPPLHFMVEPDTLDRLDDRRVFVAERAGGGVVGFLVATPVPAREGWLVEQWPRVPGAPNGTAELLVDGAMRALAAAGAAYVTLGLSPLSRHAPAVATPLWVRLTLRWVRAHGRRFYNFGGLDAFKAKLEPAAWEPIYAIAADGRFTPRTLYAIAGAFARGSPVALVARAVGAAGVQELRKGVGRLRRRGPGAARPGAAGRAPPRAP